MNVCRWLRDERGVALPMAMMTLVLLTSLMLAFAVLSQTEPVIAANQLRVSQARAFADSGFERAVWALDTGYLDATIPNTLATPLPSPVPAPYDGSAIVMVTTAGTTTLGGFLVNVQPDPAGDPNTRLITSTGWTPTNDPIDTRTKAHRKVQAKVVIIPNPALHAPCALCVKGALSVSGNAVIAGANTNTKCGGNDKHGTYTSNETEVGGSATISGGPGVTPVAQNQDASTFASFTLTNGDLDKLKELAKAAGTYWGPGYPNGGLVNNGSTTWSGIISFNSSYKMPNGIIFIDTTDGQDLTTPLASASTLANVDIHGNPFSGSNGVFSGWIVVNGSLTINGNMQINGLVYALNDLTYNGTGTGAITGLAISQNIYDTSMTSIDSTTYGNSQIIFDCDKASGGGLVPPGFTLVGGSYRELAD